MRVVVDGRPTEIEREENLLVALLKAGLHPTGGGCLCLGGDCPHCLVTLDGVSYVRACQTRAKEGMLIERDHLELAAPPLFQPDDTNLRNQAVPARHLHCDVVVIGQGPSGREAVKKAEAEGRSVLPLDTELGQEAVGIYSGPLVVARTADATLLVHADDEVIVATGAAEIQPVAPGSQLDGLVTARAAAALHRAGVDLGRIVAVGVPPEGIPVEQAAGEVVRFEGKTRVETVVVRTADGEERPYSCDTVSLGLGLHPRDALVRMGSDLPVRAVGDAARESDIPPCPRAGVVCACSGVRVEDLESVWNRGFRELELVKRATLTGTGTCQGSACMPHLRSFLLEKGKALQPAFTARPVTRQLTLGEIASGAFHRPTPRTPLHAEHESLGAQMERSGGWWRPWSYGDNAQEYAAVREGVSIGDVGTLGKFLVSGPDALEFLERIYPTHISTLRIGRSRYVLLLDERGYVLDDGLVCRDGEDRYTLTLTSAGSTFGELWLRDWADALGHDVRILNQTLSLGAINVTGPMAARLLGAAGISKLPGFARHGREKVAGVDCRIYRLSFTGELSYELHHAAADSVQLWRRLLHLGAPYGIRPHGLEVLLDLRLEKGHIVVGQDTDYDSTPRRLGHEWAVKLDKREFVGRTAVERTNRVTPDRRLVGLEMALPAPVEGEVLWHDDRWVGNVTSSTDSAHLGKAVLLAWLHLVDDELPESVVVDGRVARRVPLPFYDPDGHRARVKIPRTELGEPETSEVNIAEPAEVAESAGPAGRFERLEATRVVASPEALDRATQELQVIRIAPDELLVIAGDSSGAAPLSVSDPYAIVERETGFSGLWLAASEAEEILAATCSWKLPSGRPATAQGLVAGIPVKLYFEESRTLFLVPTALSHDLEERLGWA